MTLKNHITTKYAITRALINMIMILHLTKKGRWWNKRVLGSILSFT